MWRVSVGLLVAACSFHPGSGSQVSDGPAAPPRDARGDGQLDASPVTPALVQQTNAAANNTNAPLAATLGALPASGHLLVMIGAAEHGALTGVAGGGVTTWTRAAQSLQNTNVEIWFGITDGTSATVTISFPTSTLPIWMVVTEWSGMATTGILDSALAAAGTASPASAGALATTTARDLVFFAVADQTPNTFGTPSAGTWTALTTVSSSTTVQDAWYQVVTAAGSYVPGVPETQHHWDAAIAALRAAP